MVFDFVFDKVELRKEEFFQWLIDTMISRGWENLSKDKTKVDYWTMFSKGESGNENIGIQLRDFYNSSSDRFATSTTGSISARTFYSYTQNPSANSSGTILPSNSASVSWVAIGFDRVIQPKEMLKIYYHINKDRAIVVIENHNTSVTNKFLSMFFVIGKPYTLADYDEYCTSAVITSHGNADCVSGIVEVGSSTIRRASTFKLFSPPNHRTRNNKLARTIILQNNYDGYKYLVENIFLSNFNLMTFTADVRNQIHKDSEGRVYKQFICNETDDTLTIKMRNSSFQSFAIRIG